MGFYDILAYSCVCSEMCKICGKLFTGLCLQNNKIKNMEEQMESKFNGTVWEVIGICIIVPILQVITLGIATPWIVAWILNWVFSNSVINGKKIKFNGTGTSLFGHFIKWWILTLITLGIYYFWAMKNMIKWTVENLEIEG